jgi:pSer/pThr/pTyr-binding forkhead associated (FHA) protein
MSDFEQASRQGLRLEMARPEAVTDVLGQVLRLGAVLGLTVGVALIAVEEAGSRNIRRFALYCLLGAVVGALCGVIGSVGGQILFSMMLGGAALVGGLNPIALIVARTPGWALIGAATGVGPGVVARSPRRVAQGVLGGLIGGAAGGMVFDIVGAVTQSGSASRLIGFVLIGALVGALVSLVEEFAKEHWMTALTGALEGRSFILAKETTLLGRNEMADIPIFGDPQVQRLHARLVKSNAGVMVAAEPGLAVTVNGQPTARAVLADGDVVGIGAHRFRFGSRRAASAAAPLAPEGSPWQTAPGGIGAIPPGAVAPPLAGPGIGVAVSQLMAVAGPHTGAVYPLTPGAIIGRDPRCDIALTLDTQASRQHARLAPDPPGWRIEDGGSTNGLWVNGQRVSGHTLQSGDQIGIGQTLFRVQ